MNFINSMGITNDLTISFSVCEAIDNTCFEAYNVSKLILYMALLTEWASSFRLEGYWYPQREHIYFKVIASDCIITK